MSKHCAEEKKEKTRIYKTYKTAKINKKEERGYPPHVFHKHTSSLHLKITIDFSDKGVSLMYHIGICNIISCDSKCSQKSCNQTITFLMRPTRKLIVSQIFT